MRAISSLTCGGSGAAAKNAALSPEPSLNMDHLGQQPNYAALSPGGPHVLVWDLGGVFKQHSQEEHLPKEGLQKANLT